MRKQGKTLYQAMQVFQDALKQYARRKDKNLRTLMKYASMFHVEKILRPYWEVLLEMIATARQISYNDNERTIIHE